MAKKLAQTTSAFKLVGNIEKFDSEKNITSKETWESISFNVRTGVDTPQVSFMASKPKSDAKYTVYRSVKDKSGKRSTEKHRVSEGELKKFKSEDGWQVGGGVTIRIPKRDKDTKELILDDKGKKQYQSVSMPNHLALKQLQRILTQHFRNENSKGLGVSVTGEVNVYTNKDGETRQSLRLLGITIIDGTELDLSSMKKQVHAFNVQGVFDSATPVDDSDAVRITLGHINFKEEVTKNTYLIDPSIGKDEEEVEALKRLAQSAQEVMQFGDLIKLEGLIINRPNGGEGEKDDLAELFGGLGLGGSQTRGGYSGFTSEMKLTRVLEYAKEFYSEDDFLSGDDLDEHDIDLGDDDDDSDPFGDDLDL